MRRRHHTRRMRKTHRRSRRHHRRTRHRRGGAGNGAIPMPSPSSYSSASTYQLAVNSTEPDQYSRVFSQSSPFPPNGNAIIGVQGQRAGKRTRRNKKGGFMGTLAKGIVPFGLLALQQKFGKRKSHK